NRAPGERQPPAAGLRPDADPDAVGLHEGDVDLLLRHELRVSGDVVVVDELEAGREAELAVETQVRQALQALHLESVRRDERRVLLLGILAVRMPPENRAAGVELRQELF